MSRKLYSGNGLECWNDGILGTKKHLIFQSIRSDSFKTLFQLIVLTVVVEYI
jgi:hypothetical protein